MRCRHGHAARCDLADRRPCATLCAPVSHRAECIFTSFVISESLYRLNRRWLAFRTFRGHVLIYLSFRILVLRKPGPQYRAATFIETASVWRSPAHPSMGGPTAMGSSPGCMSARNSRPVASLPRHAALPRQRRKPVLPAPEPAFQQQTRQAGKSRRALCVQATVTEAPPQVPQ